jgi:Ca-activated chloride channel family protein
MAPETIPVGPGATSAAPGTTSAAPGTTSAAPGTTSAAPGATSAASSDVPATSGNTAAPADAPGTSRDGAALTDAAATGDAPVAPGPLPPAANTQPAKPEARKESAIAPGSPARAERQDIAIESRRAASVARAAGTSEAQDSAAAVQPAPARVPQPQPQSQVPQPQSQAPQPQSQAPQSQAQAQPGPQAQTQTPAPAPAPASGQTPAETESVVVTGSRIVRQNDQTSPSPVTTVAPDTLEEVAVTGAKRSRLREFFSSRAKQASAPAASPPPTPAASEGRDKFQHFETNPVKRVADDPVSTFSVDVDTAAYAFVRRQLNQGVLPQPDAVRVEEMINYFDYAWPVSESRDEPFKPTVTVSDSPWGKGKKLIHIGIKGYALPARQQPDVNLVLLLDVSGSMNSPDKLPLAQRSMAMLLDSLRPTDTVAIVVYAGAAGQVLAPTPVSEKETILHALNSLQAGGSTAGAEGIRLAYALAEKSFRKEGVNRILLATDGDFNVGITDQNELKGFVEREREKGVYLSVLGFGQGNYRDEMAQALAQNGNGVAAYIDTLSEARKVLVQEATSSLFPIAKDVKLQVEFNPATVAEYRLVGYETRALNREDFNNDKVDAGDVGSGHTVTAIYEITPIDSDAKLIDDSRYESPSRVRGAASRGKANEYGFLKIRYKLPNGIRSRLLEEPIRMDTGVPAALRQDVEFSTAVAGFAQLLRGSRYTGPLTFEDVIKQAQAGVGEDPFGYRTEFVQLVGKAQRARGM